MAGNVSSLDPSLTKIISEAPIVAIIDFSAADMGPMLRDSLYAGSTIENSGPCITPDFIFSSLNTHERWATRRSDWHTPTPIPITLSRQTMHVLCQIAACL